MIEDLQTSSVFVQPPELGFYQTFKGELVQIWGRQDISFITGPSIRITEIDKIQNCVLSALYTVLFQTSAIDLLMK